MRGLVIGALASSTTACWPTTSTTRIVEGRTIEGTELPDSAYSAYARAAYLESRGDLEEARAAYLEAIDIDGDSAELWTRLGSVLCRLEHADALEAFNEALEIDPRYSPAYREAGECLRRRRHGEQALEHAQRAVSYSPMDLESNLLATRLLEASGKVAEARRWFIALSLAEPNSAVAQENVLRFAVRQKDEALRQWAVASLLALTTPHPLPEGAAGKDPLGDALRDGDLVHARSLAADQGMTPAAVALYAADVGALPLAIAQARLVLGANPDDSDARIALLAAALRSGDTKARDEALSIPETPSRPSATAVTLMERTLDTFVGTDAAKEFRAAADVVLARPPEPRPTPPLPRPSTN